MDVLTPILKHWCFPSLKSIEGAIVQSRPFDHFGLPALIHVWYFHLDVSVVLVLWASERGGERGLLVVFKVSISISGFWMP